MSIPHLVVVTPAFNEADGIAEFIAEVWRDVSPHAEVLDIVVIDDASTDDTAAQVLALGLRGVHVVVQRHNRGHGPAAIAAYRGGLARGADVILHVDGDGQFDGADIAKVALSTESHDVVHGVRRGRSDLWYRRILSTGLRLLIWPFARRRIPDVNTPLRAYRPDALRALIDLMDPNARVPHIHFSLAEARRGMRVGYVPVRSRPRRGSQATGTMWGADSEPRLPPKRLRLFARQALIELWRLSLAPRAPMRGAAARNDTGLERGVSAARHRERNPHL